MTDDERDAAEFALKKMKPEIQRATAFLRERVAQGSASACEALAVAAFDNSDVLSPDGPLPDSLGRMVRAHALETLMRTVYVLRRAEAAVAPNEPTH